MLSLNKTKLYVIIPITIPGMEKNLFYEPFQRIVKENNFGFDMISMREVKQEFIENFSRKGQNLTEEKAYLETKRAAKSAFKSRLGDLLRECTKTSYNTHFLFVDKNHPTFTLEPTFDIIRQNSRGVDLKTIALVPRVNSGISYINKKNQTCYYPFSANLLLTCFDRVRKRRASENSDGQDDKSAGFCLYHLNMFKNISLNNATLAKYGFHKLFYVPFSDETNSSNLPQELIDALIDTLKSSNQQGNNFDNRCLNYFNNLFEKLKLEFKDPDASNMENSIRSFLEKEIYPEVFSHEFSPNMQF